MATRISDKSIYMVENYGIILPLIVEETIIAYGQGPVVERILSNIINNSAEASSLNIGISVEVDGENSRVSVHIVDDGDGIPEDIIHRVGETGFTTKARGSGLGLSHAILEMKRFNGDLTIESYFRSGTKVLLNFEIAEMK